LISKVQDIKLNNLPLKGIYASGGMFELMDWAEKVLISTKNEKIKDVYKEDFTKKNIEGNIKSAGIGWYGTNNASEVISPKTSFLFSEKSNELLEQLRKKTERIDVSILNQKKKIEFNDRQIGIFSFDLASLGLIPVVEYYSPLLEYIVNPNFVKMKKEDGKKVFYHVEIPFVQEHKLIDKGTHLYSPVLNINVEREKAIPKALPNGDIVMLLPERQAVAMHQVEQRQVLLPNGKKKFSSTNKKSFIYLDIVKKRLPQIDIIISVSFSASVNATSEMLYNSLAISALMETLERNNVKFRLFYMDMAMLKNKDTGLPAVNYFNIVKLKDINDSVDYNMIGIVSSDARFYRFEGFKNNLATIDDFQLTNLRFQGYGAPNNNYLNLVESFNKVISKTKDYGTADPETFEGENDFTKIIFPASLSERQAFEAYERAINKIKGMLS
jgi:hypothetical protein